MPFVARFSPWRRVAALAVCLGFVVLGLWIAGALGDAGPNQPLVGWLSVITFGAFAVIGLVRLPLRGPAVRVDQTGIWIWRPGGGVAVPWTAIVAAEQCTMHRQHFLCLTVDEPHRYRAPGLAGSANKALGFGDIAIGVQGTDRRFAELIAAVGQFGTASG